LTKELFIEPFYLVVPSGHRLAKTPNPTTKMLAADEMLLLEDGHCLRDQALDVCPAEGTWQRNRYQAASLETLRHMVASGAGYTLFPALAVPGPGQLKNLLKYRPFKSNAPGRTIALVWRRSGSVAGDTKALADFIRGNLPPKVKIIKS
jgi:LysR family hydrogen peroxide-inducible transcriptional activator